MLNEVVPKVKMNEVIKKVSATYRKLYQPAPKNLSFRITKVNDNYAYTYVSEELKYSFGLNKKMAGEKPGQFAKIGQSKAIQANFERCWNGNQVAFCVKSIFDFELMVFLNPIFKNNKVVEMMGNCIEITKWRELNKRISFCDTNGNFIYTDDENVAVSGYSAETLLTSNIVTLVHPKDKEIIKRKFADILVTKKPDYATYRIKKANGRWIKINAEGVPFTDENNDCLGIIIFTDSKPPLKKRM